MAHVEDRWHASRDGRKVRTDRYGKPGRWRVRGLGPGQGRSFDRRVDAEAYLATVQAELLRGEYVDRSDRRTVAQAAREYAAARPHGPRTARRVAQYIRVHIEPTPLGRRRLAEVRPSEVQAWITDRSRTLAPGTLKPLVGFLRSVFAAAVIDRKIGSSPMVRLQLPSTSRERLVPLSVEQVRRVAEAVPPRCKAMVLTQAGLGLRIGELLALRVDDVDFLRRTVRIEWQIPPGERTRSRPKTPTSRRTIPLPQVVSEALAEHIRQFPPAADGTLFTTSTGRVYSHAYYGAQLFKNAIRALPDVPDSTTTHDLRHHYASVLLAAGRSVIEVAERLGHENATLVLTTYGHLIQGQDDRTRQAIDEAWTAQNETATSQARPGEAQ
jgi:integrase